MSRDYIKYGNEIGDKILPLAFKHLNDALFYPRALRWGVIEMACAAIDLAMEDVSEQCDNTVNVAATADNNGTTTADTTVENESSNSKKNNTKNDASTSSMKSIFRNEWWRRYEVSNEHFQGCRNNLSDAMSYLRSYATATTSCLDTDSNHKPSLLQPS